MQGSAHHTTNLIGAVLFPYQAVTSALHAPFNPLFAVVMGLAIAVAARLPDQAERLPFFNMHRGASHLPALWLAVALLPHMVWQPSWPPIAGWAISGLGIGALYHLAADIWDRGGVPLLTPRGPRISLRLYATGKTPAFLGVAIMACLFTVTFILAEWPHYLG